MGWMDAPEWRVQVLTGEVRWLRGICSAGGRSHRAIREP